MLLILHIGIALTSLVNAAYVLFSPSLSGLRVTYGLIGATLLTGFGLVFMNPSHLPQVCSTGLTYVTVMLLGVAFIRRRIAKLQSAKL